MIDLQGTLNDKQQEAVTCIEGPLLVLAGAGSGKTRVLIHRIAYLIEEKKVNPWNILAITFTNKAASEMKARVRQTVSQGADSVWVSTFHSACVRILRRHCEHLGYDASFSIYDADDQKSLMRQVLKTLDVDPKLYKDKAMIGYVSDAKNGLITPEDFEEQAMDFRQRKIALIYKTYQDELSKNNAMDFDDLIMKTVELFQAFPEILSYYQERFRYILVDEYQDTNFAQYKLVELLASRYRNICVVGDDDQSIYRFRGADVRIILNFENAFPGARIVKLEQNYRSTGNILTAANGVIRHNFDRKDKTLWTDNEKGRPVWFRQFDTSEEEAAYIVRSLMQSHEKGKDWKDMAVLYRTNTQSRLLEEFCIAYNIPYLLVGGVNFYQRKEIKDILAYLKTIANGVDDLAVARIINVPRRGIGAVTIGKVAAFASEHGMHLYDGVKAAEQIPGIGKAARKLKDFSEQIEAFRAMAAEPQNTIGDLIEDILNRTGYQQELEGEEGEEEAKERLENIQELKSKAVSYSNEAENPDLIGFLEQVALVAEIDRMDENQSRVTLMTLHSAKGLEFPIVFLAGMEDGLFPSSHAIFSGFEAVEEERRLCYVGITRAKEELTMTSARQRMMNGESRYSRVSRFVEEISSENLEEKGRGSDQEGSRSENRLLASAQAPQSDGSGLAQARIVRKGSVSSFGPEKTAGFGKTFSVTKASHLDYQEGDRVHHAKYGDGVVNEIKDGKKDYEVTVCFDEVGVKKMLASFAKLEKIT